MIPKESRIAREIARTTRNLLVVNLFVLALFGSCSPIVEGNDLWLAVRGPAEHTGAEFLARNNDFRWSEYIAVTGSREREAEAVTKTGKLILLDLGGEWLLVNAPAGRPDHRYEGQLKRMTGRLKSQVRNPFVAAHPHFKDKIVDHYLDGSWSPDWLGDMKTTLGLLAGVLLGAWNIVKALLRMRDPRRHPVWKALEAAGEPAMVAQSLDTELAGEVKRAGDGRLEVTPSWMLRPAVLDVVLIRRADIVGTESNPPFLEGLRLKLGHRALMGIRTKDDRVTWIPFKTEGEHHFARGIVRQALED